MKKILLSVVSVSLIWACSGSKQTASNLVSQNSNSEDAKVSAVVWQQTSAEYEALCYQAFNIASARLTSSNLYDDSSTGREFAIVMDLDETVLNNSPYNGWLIQNNKSYSKESWKEWSGQVNAAFIPGAIEFIEAARHHGFKVFFISNRTEEELENTVANLEKGGIIVDPSDVLLKSTTSSKSERRQNVLSTYDIFMLIGDNLADFDDQFEKELSATQRKQLAESFKESFGYKFIVLPNTIYGDWEKALEVENSDDYRNDNANGLKRFVRGY